MTTDERLLNYYNKEYYQKILSSGSYVSLMRKRLNRFNSQTQQHATNLASIDAFENYMIFMIHNHPNQLDRHLMARYRDQIFNELTKNRYLIFDSPIFYRENATLLFTPDQLAQIEATKQQVANISRATYDKIINGQPTTPTETEVFLRFLITQITNPNHNTKKILENIYSKLLQSPNPKSLTAKEFILKYSAHLTAEKLSVPEPHIYLIDVDMQGKPYQDYNYGTSVGNSGIVTINRHLIDIDKPFSKDIPCLLKFIQTIAHEVKHSAQAYETEKGTYSFASYEYIKFLLFSSRLSRQDFNEYNTNYRYSEIESDANRFGWRFASDILNKYAPKQLEKIKREMDSHAIVTQYQEALAHKTDGKKRMVKEKYNTNYLDQIISREPSLLQKYPLLTAIYNQNGQRKNLLELLESEQTTCKNNHNSIDLMFYEHFVAAFHRQEFNQIVPETLTTEQQFLYFGKIIDLVIQEIIHLKRTIKIIDRSSEQVFSNVNKIRIQRIKDLLNMLNQYQELINKLREIDILAGNRHAFGARYRYIDDYLVSLKANIKENEHLKELPLYQELLSIGEVKLDGPKY